MTDLDRAKELLRNDAASCILCKDEAVFMSDQRGVRFLIDQYHKKRDLSGFSAADKIIGKASALLLVLMGVHAVHASVISEAAIEVFHKAGVSYSFDKRVAYISNRTGTGLCPMEQVVQTLESPSAALTAIEQSIRDMQRQN